MAGYVIYVHDDGEGGYLAHVPALPGCAAHGATRDEATQRVTAVVNERLAKLGQRGEAIPQEFLGPPVRVEETKDMILPEDYSPVDPVEVPGLLRLMEESRQEMLAQVSGLAPEALDWKPDESSWPIRDVLEHVSNAERWYISRLTDWPRQGLPRLAAIRQWAIEKLSGTSETEWSRVTYNYQEEWTARKACRRMLEHERLAREWIGRQLRTYACAHGADAAYLDSPGRTSRLGMPVVNKARKDVGECPVYLEGIEKGEYQAHAADLPGCVATGKTREEALARLPGAVKEAAEYLQGRGESLPEAFSTGPWLSRDSDHILPTDCEPLTSEELLLFIAALQASRRALITQVDGLPDQALDWKAEGERWTIRELVEYVGTIDWWCMRCLEDWPREVFTRLAAVRQMAVERLTNLTEAERSRVTVHALEEWTARKVFRRFLEHEREHRDHMADILRMYHRR